MNRIILIYNRANQAIAAQIDQQLSRIGIPFEHIGGASDLQPGKIAAFLQSTQEPVLLLLTDNFLKDTTCMADLLPAFQVALSERRILPVVADGRYSNDGGITYHAVPTQYDRMVNALQFMNYWQNTWLELSDQHTHTQGDAKEALVERLNITRNIANEMGDFISALRESGAVTLTELVSDHYAIFFQKFNLTQWHDPYRKIALQGDIIPEKAVENLPAPVADEAPAMADVTPSEAMGQAGVNEMEEPESAALTSGSLEVPIVSEETPSVLKASGSPADDDLLHQVSENEGHLPDLDLHLPDDATVFVRPEGSDTEIEQHIHDAWFWMNNGRADQGLEIFQTAMEQYPESEQLHREYEKAKTLHPIADVGAPDILTSKPVTPPIYTAEPVPNNDILSSEARSYELMGDMAYQKNDFLFAKYCWDRTIELAPEYPGIYRKLGVMVSEVLPEYRETGIQYLKNALRQNPNDAEAQLAAAKMALQNNEPDAAEVYYRSAIALNAALQTPANDQIFLPGYVQQTRFSVPGEIVIPKAAELPMTAEPEKTTTAETELAETARDYAELHTTPAPEDATADIADAEPEMPHVALIVESEIPEMPALQELMDADFQEPDMLQVITLDERAALNPVVNPAAEPAPAEPESEQRSEPAASEPEPEPIPAATVPAREALTVLITGATSGIGRSIAELFAKNGHRLIVTGRRIDRLVELKNHFESEWNTPMLMLPFDVRDYGAVRAALETLPDGWQDIDILINNAGLAKGFSPIQEGNLDHWETMIDTNLKGLLYVTRVVAPGMVRRRSGHIINIGSIAGQEAYPNGNVYCATKAGVDSLTRAMRMDLYTHNIRVSQVTPGHVEATEFAINRFDGDADRAGLVYKDFKPLLADDVADVIYYMATRPPHVNIQDVVMFGTQQASATLVDRSGRM